MLAVACVGAGFDARDPPLFHSLAAPWRTVAEDVTRLGLSGYIFASAATIGFGGLVLRGRGFGKLADAAFGLIAGRAVFVIAVNAASGMASQALKHLVGRARPALFASVGALPL